MKFFFIFVLVLFIFHNLVFYATHFLNTALKVWPLSRVLIFSPRTSIQKFSVLENECITPQTHLISFLPP